MLSMASSQRGVKSQQHLTPVLKELRVYRKRWNWLATKNKQSIDGHLLSEALSCSQNPWEVDKNPHFSDDQTETNPETQGGAKSMTNHFPVVLRLNWISQLSYPYIPSGHGPSPPLLLKNQNKKPIMQIFSDYIYENLQKKKIRRLPLPPLLHRNLFPFCIVLRMCRDRILWEALSSRPDSGPCWSWAPGKPNCISVPNRLALFVCLQMKRGTSEPFEPYKTMKMTGFSSARLGAGFFPFPSLWLKYHHTEPGNKDICSLRTSSRASPCNIWSSFFGELAGPGEQLLLGALMNKRQ